MTRAVTIRRLVTVFTITFCACRSASDRGKASPGSSATTEPTAALPVVIGRNPDEGWGGDVEVPAKVVRVEEHSFVVRTHGTIDGKPVELEVSFAEPTQGMMGVVELRPVGAGADALLAAMAKAWKQPAPTKPARKVRVPAAWLVGTASDARKSATRTKVFFEEQDAEFYVNWNPQTSMLELFEKDEGYRAGVLGALTGP